MEVYDFGARLKELRQKRNLSQTTAAEKLNVTRSTVSAYERNTKTPRLEIIIKMAVIYHTSVDYMLGLESRTSLYLDDLTESQQRMVMDIVERLKQELCGEKKLSS